MTNASSNDAPLPPGRFTFYVGQPPEQITADRRQWYDALPLSRHDLTASPGSPAGRITYGDYFTAAADFLSRNGAAMLRKAGPILKRRLSPEALTRIHIHLIKHGAFYHPALVRLCAGRDRIPMILNVAVDDPGRRCLAAEIAALDHLNLNYAEAYVPIVYGAGTGRTSDGRSLPMFAGQWLDHFYEVHRSPAGKPADRQSWSVWDTELGCWSLNEHQTARLFEQAAYILTYHFDPHTLSTVRSWHNAAGDFVVRKNKNDIDVRLITVRRYAPLIRLDDDETVDLETLLHALTLFLLQTSLWLRIDRIDGVGELAWADEQFLLPIWRGFAQGLRKMAATNAFPTEFAAGVFTYLLKYSTKDLLDLGLQIASRYPADLPEADLIRGHLPAHAAQLAAAIKTV